MPTQAQKKNNRSSISLTRTESVVSEIWAEVLQQDRIKPGDNFFERGGDSMMTMMVLFQVNDILSVDLPTSSLFKAPTLRQFCHMIDDSRDKSASHGLVNNLTTDIFEEDTDII
ncbi:phosphopantetheine-binding protein [Thermodesulfobacteriota bacterium]